jgi:hypothetical protein
VRVAFITRVRRVVMATRKATKKKARKSKAKKRTTVKRPARRRKHTSQAKPTRPIPKEIEDNWVVQVVKLDQEPTIGIEKESEFRIESANIVRKKSAVHWNGSNATIRFHPIPLDDIAPPHLVLRAHSVKVSGGPKFKFDLGLIGENTLDIAAATEATGSEGGGSGTATRGA